MDILTAFYIKVWTIFLIKKETMSSMGLSKVSAEKKTQSLLYFKCIKSPFYYLILSCLFINYILLFLKCNFILYFQIKRIIHFIN